MKQFYYFLVNSGKVLIIWTLLTIISISAYSLIIRGKVNYGGRCYQQFDDSIIKEYEYKGIVLKSSELNCNTYYIEYNSNLDESDNLLFLVSLSKLIRDNNINCNFHISIVCDTYQLLSTIVDYQVSYTKSII